MTNAVVLTGKDVFARMQESARQRGEVATCRHGCLWKDHDQQGYCMRDCERCPEKRCYR